MNRLLLRASLVAAMLMLLTSAAFAVPAPGLNLAWFNCATQGGVQNQDFLCDADDATEVVVGSFVLSAAAPGVTGVEIVVDLISATPSLPAWWDLDTGGCREGNLSMNAVAPFTNALCKDWANGTGSGGLGSYSSDLGSIDPGNAAAHKRLIGGFAVGAPRNLVTAKEYYTFNIVIQTAGTVTGPPGPCTGCLTPVCIVFNSVKVVADLATAEFIGNPSSGTSNQVTWQAGVGANCAAVPVKNATWGQVKALYR